MNKKKKRDYIDVNVPRIWERFLEEALRKPEIQKKLEHARYRLKPSSLGVWIIRNFLIDNTSYRFDYINSIGKKTTIYDKKLTETFDVLVQPDHKRLFCPKCDSAECDHVKFVYTLPHIKQFFKKKGWELPDFALEEVG